ncbi:odorant receptor 131-2-like [Mantella aurantiaca]
MTNISENTTQIANTGSLGIIKFFLLGFILTSFILVFYFMAVMLSVFFTSAVARQEVRYILFAHMLVNDSVYLFIAVFLYVASSFPTKYPAPFCYVFSIVSSTCLKISPYNLAIMSLERFVAICFPLRHREICTLRRMGIALAIIWAIGLLPNIADIFILTLTVEKTFFAQNMACDRSFFIVASVQDTVRLASHASTFCLVGLIIVFTYIRIMLVALRADSGKASASKAGRTVMLHAFQLLLCMLAYSYRMVEIIFKDYYTVVSVINFCFFMYLPRVLSPFIYGVRDELFRKQIKKFTLCGVQKCVAKNLE